MSIKIRSKHSSVANKAPLPADLVEGEIALNINSASPAAYIKDSAGAIVKLAGVGSVSTPDATDAVKGVVELATATETVDGVDTTRAVTPAGLKSALGAQAGSSTAPAAPVVGQVWVDNSTSPSVVKVWGGTPAAWIPQVGGTVTGTTAPATPVAGTIWVDTSATPNVVKIWDGTAWVTATPDGSAAAAIANDAKYATKAEMPWVRTGTNTVLANAGDKVGLGDSAPANKLQVLEALAAIPSLGSGGHAVAVAGSTNYGLALGGLTSGEGYLQAGRWSGAATAYNLLLQPKGGSVGIGTTSPSSLLHVQGTGNPVLLESTNDTYSLGIKGTGATQTAYLGVGSSNALQFYVSGSERFRCDSSGRLLIGTSLTASAGTFAQNSLLQVRGNAGNSAGAPSLSLQRGAAAASMAANSTVGAIAFSDNAGNEFGWIECLVDATAGSGDYPGRLTFSTTPDGSATPVERLRIDSGGTTKSTNAGTNFLAVNPDNASTTSFFYGQRGVTEMVNIRADGSIKNVSGTVGTISDRKLKENITPAHSQWDDLKALDVVNFDFTKESGYQPLGRQLGFIAQDVEKVCPGVVDETPDRDENGNDLGTTTKSVKTSIITLKAIKALQEAMERIEALEAKVAALESK